MGRPVCLSMKTHTARVMRGDIFSLVKIESIILCSRAMTGGFWTVILIAKPQIKG